MKRNLIAVMTAAAFILTSLTATPAVADSKNSLSTLEAILGIVALGVLVNELDGNKSKDRKHNSNDWKYKYKVIPASCVFPVRGHKERRDVVSSHCLRNAGVRGPYPQRCASEIRTRYGKQTVFGANCMRNNGFRIGGRRY